MDAARKEKLRRAFDLFDQKGAGLVAATDIGTLVRSLGENPTEAKLRDIEKSANSSAGGTVTFDVFLNIMQDLADTTKKLSASDIEDAFRVFDTENTGSLPVAELKRVLTSFGEKLSDEEVEGLLNLVDTTPDGKIDYIELSKKLIA